MRGYWTLSVGSAGNRTQVFRAVYWRPINKAISLAERQIFKSYLINWNHNFSSCGYYHQRMNVSNCIEDLTIIFLYTLVI